VAKKVAKKPTVRKKKKVVRKKKAPRIKTPAKATKIARKKIPGQRTKAGGRSIPPITKDDEIMEWVANLLLRGQGKGTVKRMLREWVERKDPGAPVPSSRALEAIIANARAYNVIRLQEAKADVRAFLTGFHHGVLTDEEQRMADRQRASENHAALNGLGPKAGESPDDPQEHADKVRHFLAKAEEVHSQEETSDDG
jgi:hypothetical protein